LNEELAGPVYKTEINGRGHSLRSPRNSLYPQKLALTSETSGLRSVGIVRLRTKATEFSLLVLDRTLHNYRCENLKSQDMSTFLCGSATVSR
jgi:hypothetical protein